MEISEDESEDTEVDKNRKYYGFSESRDHEGLDNYEPDHEESITM